MSLNPDTPSHNGDNSADKTTQWEKCNMTLYYWNLNVWAETDFQVLIIYYIYIPHLYLTLQRNTYRYFTRSYCGWQEEHETKSQPKPLIHEIQFEKIWTQHVKNCSTWPWALVSAALGTSDQATDTEGYLLTLQSWFSAIQKTNEEVSRWWKTCLVLQLWCRTPH